MADLDWSVRIVFATYRNHSLYEVQKGLSISLWKAGYGPLPYWATAVCAVCAVKERSCYLGKKAPEAHHLLIPRNYTRNVDRTVNWYWNLVPVHQECHKEAHGKELKDRLILKQAELIGRHILHEENDMAAQFGLAWILEQIQLEGLKIHIPLPVTKY